MKKFFIVPILGVLAILAACTTAATDPAVQAVQRVSIACDSYSSSLNVLAVLKAQDKLTEAQTASVNDIVEVVAPICENPSAPVDDLLLLSTLENNIVKLILLREGVQ